MPTYTVQAPDGRSVDLEGDSPPSEQELEQIFASVGSTKWNPQMRETGLDFVGRDIGVPPMGTPIPQLPTVTMPEQPAQGFGAIGMPAQPAMQVPSADSQQLLEAFGRTQENPSFLTQLLNPSLRVNKGGSAGTVASEIDKLRNIGRGIRGESTATPLPPLSPMGQVLPSVMQATAGVGDFMTTPEGAAMGSAAMIPGGAEVPLLLRALGIGARAKFGYDMAKGTVEGVQALRDNPMQTPEQQNQASQDAVNTVMQAAFLGHLGKGMAKDVGLPGTRPVKAAPANGDLLSQLQANLQPTEPLQLRNSPIVTPPGEFAPKPTTAETLSAAEALLAKLKQQQQDIIQQNVANWKRPEAPPIDVESWPVLNQLADIEKAQKAAELSKSLEQPAKPFQQETVNTDLRQLQKQMQQNTVGGVEQAPVVSPVHEVAKELGLTVNEQAQRGSVSMEGLPPEYAAKLAALQPQQIELTDRRAGSPTKGATIYVPKDATPEQIYAKWNVKAEEHRKATAKEAPVQGAEEAGLDAERQIEKKDTKNKLYSGMPLFDPDFWRGLGIKENVKVSAEQLYNRIRNKAGETSSAWDMAKDVLPKTGELSVQEAQKLVEENGPKVEVRKFGNEVGMTEAERENGRLIHELDTVLPNWRRLASNEVPEKYKELYNKQYQLSQTIPVRETEASHWQSVAPKAEKDMPGYVEIAVVKPVKTIVHNKEQNIRSTNEQFPSSHNFPPNTLGFTRGYMETLPDGKKVFHVIEVQSDWGQRVRQLEQLNKEKGTEGIQAGIRKGELDNLSDPLLRDYNRLALKAAIEHARDEGATHIAISDAETAMLTEGHDQAAQEQLKPFRTHNEAEDFAGSLPESADAKVKESKSGVWHVEYLDIRQEKGMRLNYDSILPKIAEELTGSKGERVEMGEHKMVYDVHGTDYQGNNVLENKRTNLIFRNPDGTPKTSVSGMMYPLEKVSQMLEKKPFTLTGKDKLISRLEAMLKQKGQDGQLHALGVIPHLARTVRDAGLRLAIEALKTDPSKVKEAMRATLDHWSKNSEKGYDPIAAENMLRKEFGLSGTIPQPTAARDTDQRAKQELGVFHRLLEQFKLSTHFKWTTPEEVFDAKMPVKETTLDAFSQALKDSKPARRETEKLRTEERRKIAGRLSGIQDAGLGEAGVMSQKGAAKGELPRVDLEPLREKMTQAQIDSLYNHINTHTALNGQMFTKLNLNAALQDLLNNGKLPQPSQVAWFERLFGPKVVAPLLMKYPKSRMQAFVSAANIFKSIKGSFDASAIGRQGFSLGVAHPELGAQGIARSFHAMSDRKYALELDSELKSGDAADVRREAKLDMTSIEGLSDVLIPAEELYGSHGIQNLRFVEGETKFGKAVIGIAKPYAKGLAFSERGFATYLNWLRANVFDSVDKELMKRDYTPEILEVKRKQLAKLINAATGRGNVNPGALMNFFIWSPKLKVSRIEYPARAAAYSFDKGPVGAEARRQVISQAATWGSLYLLLAVGASAFGWKAKFQTDPQNANFGKIVTEDGATIDVSAGYGASTRYLTQGITGKKTDAKGREQDVDRVRLLGQYVRNSASPAFDALWNAQTGKDFNKQPTGYIKEGAKLFIPLPAEQAVEFQRAFDSYGLLYMLPETFGFGVNAPPAKATSR